MRTFREIARSSARGFLCTWHFQAVASADARTSHGTVPQEEEADELDEPRVAQAGDPLEPAPNSSVSPGPMRPSPGPMRPSPSAADVTGVPAGPSHACTDGRRCRLRFGARVHVQRQRRLGGRPLFSSISQLIVSYSALHFMLSLGEIAEPVAHLRRCRGLDRKQDISSLGLAVGCGRAQYRVPCRREGLDSRIRVTITFLQRARCH